VNLYGFELQNPSISKEFVRFSIKNSKNNGFQVFSIPV